MEGLIINNDRGENHYDMAFLNSFEWSGMLQGIDGYPTKCETFGYCIAGGDSDPGFNATAIEFYGVKTQIFFKFLFYLHHIFFLVLLRYYNFHLIL